MKIKLLILTTVIILLSIGCSKNVVETVEIIEPQYKQYPALPESKPTQIAMRSFINGDFAASQGDFVNGLRLLRVAANQDTMSFMIKKRILDTMLAKAQSDPGIIPEAVTYAEDMYSKNLYDNDVLISMAQAYLLNNQPEDALRIYNLKLEYKPEGQDYLRIFVIKAKYLKDMSISDLDKAYEFSNNNPRLIMTIANLRAQFDPEGTIIMLNDAISTNFESQLLDLLINLLEKKGAEDSIVKVLSENISNLSEFQKGILIEVHYNKENFPEIIKHFDYYYDTNELQIQKYLFFACIGKDHLLLLDKIYARLVNNPDIEAEDVEILSLMAAESWWLDRNPEKTAEYLCKIDEFSFIHDFFIKRFVSKFSVEEKTTLEYLVRILSENGLDQSLEDFLIARNYYLNDNHEMALEYAKKVDPKVLVKHHIVSALALIALQSGDDVEWAKKLFDMSSDEETISVNDVFGQYYYKQKEYSKAKKYLDLELESNPKPSLYTFQLITALLDRDQLYKEEIEYFRKALVHYPNEADILNALAYLLTITGTLSDEIPFLLENALQTEPENINYIDSYGWYYYMTGDYEKAKTYMDSILKLGFDSSVIAYHVGAVYAKLNDFEMANEYYLKAQILNNDDEAVLMATEALKKLNK